MGILISFLAGYTIGVVYFLIQVEITDMIAEKKMREAARNRKMIELKKRRFQNQRMEDK